MINYKLYRFLNKHYALNLTDIDEFKESFVRSTYYNSNIKEDNFLYPNTDMTTYDRRIIHGMIKAGELFGVKKASLYYILHTTNPDLKPFVLLIVKKNTEYIVDNFDEETTDMLYENLYHALDYRDLRALEPIKDIRKKEGISPKFKQKIDIFKRRLEKKHNVKVDRVALLKRHFNIKEDIVRPYRKIDPLVLLKKYLQNDGKTIILPTDHNDYFILYRHARNKNVSLENLINEYGYIYGTSKKRTEKDLIGYFTEKLSKISDDTGKVHLNEDNQLYIDIKNAGHENDLTVYEMFELLEFQLIS